MAHVGRAMARGAGRSEFFLDIRDGAPGAVVSM
jgi:hypothetical protein